MKSYISGSACEVLIEQNKKRIFKRVHHSNEGIENGYHKLIHEIKYLEQMNKESTLFPRILSSFYKDEYLYAEIEYLYEGQSLGDLIFDNSVSSDYLDLSIMRLLDVLFGRFYVKQVSEINKKYWYDCYINRTIRRLDVSLDLFKEKKLNWEALKECILHGVTVNGIHYESAYRYMEYLNTHKNYLERIQPHCTYRSHHDLIPENIIVQKGENSISDFKMIDPRGESETGSNNRHYIYDMGKMIFGLDCYGLFRRAYHDNNFDNFKLIRNASNEYELMYSADSSAVQKLIRAQKVFLEKYYEYSQKIATETENTKWQIMFSAACMYIPDIPCRIIDEGMEDLCIAFYVRGCMFLHELMLEIYGYDELSSDINGKAYTRWLIN